jgi:telomerase Cajal body protein 1
MDCPINFNSSVLLGSKGKLHGPDITNFPRQMKLSPDGLFALFSNEDDTVQIWSLPSGLVNKQRYYQVAACDAEFNDTWNLQSSVPVGESIYDIDWYPQMNSATQGTSCYAVTSRDHPVHLFDSISGELRSSYNCVNRLDELDSALSVAFNNDGSKLYAGADSVVYCFDVASPGAQVSVVRTTKSKKDKRGIKGLISCLAFNPDRSGVYAAGSFAHSVGVYVENQSKSALELQQLGCGVTCMKWSRCGSYLWVGGRKTKDIQCWDIRHSRREVGRVPREASSNQKLCFDLDPWGRYIASGDSNGQ